MLENRTEVLDVWFGYNPFALSAFAWVMLGEA